MYRVKEIIISRTQPEINNVGWLIPLEDGTFKLKFFGANGWVDAASGVQGPAGTDGKSITAINLVTNAEGAITGGTATLSDESTIQITVTQE